MGVEQVLLPRGAWQLVAVLEVDHRDQDASPCAVVVLVVLGFVELPGEVSFELFALRGGEPERDPVHAHTPVLAGFPGQAGAGDIGARGLEQGAQEPARSSGVASSPSGSTVVAA